MIALRELKGLAECRAAYDLQHSVWGADDLADPPDLMMVLQSEGGMLAGAFADERLVGYVFGFATGDPGVQYSHRLAVLPAWQGQGLGAALKAFQLAWCAERGVRIIRWTYDPLMLRNARLNITSLGALGMGYRVNYYGSGGSYQGGIDSDRLVAERHVAGRPPVTQEDRVPVAPDFPRLLREDPEGAQAARLASREALQQRFAAGLIITGFDAATAAYLFGRRAA